MTTALRQYVNGSVSVSGDQLNTFEQTCDNAAQLRTLYGTTGMQVYIRGITAPNDGGQGPFYWNATGTGPDDNLNIIVPLGSTSGVWSRIVLSSTAGANVSNALATATGSTTARTLANRFADLINVKDFGAVGDGVTDDTSAIQAAATAIPSAGGTLFFPAAQYAVAKTVVLKSNTYVSGPGATLVALPTWPASPYSFFQNSTRVIGTQTDHDIYIEGLAFDYTNLQTVPGGGNHAVNFLAVRNFGVTNCRFTYGNDAIAAINCIGGLMAGNWAYYNNNCPYDMWGGCQNMRVENNYAESTTAVQAVNFNAFAGSADPTGAYTSSGCVISGNVFNMGGTGANTILVSPLATNCAVNDVEIRGNVLKGGIISGVGNIKNVTVAGNVIDTPTTASSAIQFYTDGTTAPANIHVLENHVISPTTSVGNLGVIRVWSIGYVIRDNSIIGSGYGSANISTSTYAGIIGPNDFTAGNGSATNSGSAFVSTHDDIFVPNGEYIRFIDTAGNRTGRFGAQPDNYVALSSTGSTGAARPVFAIQGLSDTSGLLVYPTLIAGAALANQVKIFGNTTGNAPAVAAYGSDTNISLQLSGQGTGSVLLNNGFSVDGSGNITGLNATLHGVNQTGNYNVSGANGAANSWIYGTPYYFGKSSDANFAANYIGLSDQVNVYGANAGNGLSVTHSYGGANSAGGRTAIYGHVYYNIATNPGDASGDLTGLHGWASSAVANGGTTGIVTTDGTGYRHGMFGGWLMASLTGVATGYAGLTGAEIDVTLASTAETALKVGLNIVLTSADAARGTYDDVGLHFGQQSPSTTPGWKNLISVGRMAGSPGSATDTVAFMAQPRIYGGTSYASVPLGLFADLRQATNTKGVLWSPNFAITGAGAAYANGLTTNGTVQAQTAAMTSVTIDAAGEYTTVPVWVVQAPPAGGTTATVTTATMGGVRALPYATGKSYTNADTLTVVGGTGTAPTLRPTVDANGACVSWAVLTNGSLSSAPPNPITLSGGSGTGAIVNIVWDNSPGYFVPSVITAAATGSGFAVNDTFSPVGDNGTEPVYKVTSVTASGGILTSTLNSAGSLIALAAGAHSVTTSGAGTAASITPTFGVLSVSVAGGFPSGSGYLPAPPPKILPANANSTNYTVATLPAVMTPASATLSLNPSGGAINLGASASVDASGNATAHTVGTATYTVATLPTAGTAGRRAFVTDANATTFQTIVAGGGTNKVPVFDDATNWRIG
jgi:hypothetical protein